MQEGDLKFYLLAVAGLTVVAAGSAIGLTLSGVKENIIISILTPVTGFVALIVLQFRTTATTNAKVEQVAKKADVAAGKAQEIAATVAVNNEEHSAQLAEIKQTAEEVKATTEDLKAKAEQIHASTEAHGSGLNNLTVALQVVQPAENEGQKPAGG